MANVKTRSPFCSSSLNLDSSCNVSRPMSRLEQMQANLHRKLLQEKEEKMVQMHTANRSRTMDKASLDVTCTGGNVRRFFEERRAMNLDGSMNLDNSLSSLDSYFLNASNRLIARNASNSTVQRPKKGSPLGWDKSYPLVPIERTNSGSSSGYESVGGSKRFLTDPGRRVPHVRRQSLDRTTAGTEDAATSINNNNNNMRRSKSQIFEGERARGVTARNKLAAVSQAKERRFSRDEDKRKLQQEMRQREQELINKIKEQQAEIERMRQEKIKEEKAQKARLYRKPAPLPRRSPSQDKVVAPAHNPAAPAQSQANVDDAKAEASKPLHRLSSPEARPSSVTVAEKYRPPVAPSKSTITKKPPVRSSTNANSDLPECPQCNRRFAADRIEKHLSICKKVSTKKRKTFDPVKMRTEGTEQENYLRKGKPAAKVESLKKSNGEVKKSNWRQKHENFLQTIRQAKTMQEHVAAGGKLSDLPPPPPMDTSDYLQCPHCLRKFSQGAAERHIPKCQNIRSNKK